MLQEILAPTLRTDLLTEAFGFRMIGYNLTWTYASIWQLWIAAMFWQNIVKADTRSLIS